MKPDEVAALLKLARENGILPMGDPEDLAEMLNSSRPKIRLPGENRELGQFAREVGEILALQNLFRRDLTPVTVNAEKKRTDPVSAEWLRTWAEHHLVCFKDREFGSGSSARVIQVVKTMNVDTARGTLASSQFFSQLREIERVNPIRLPIVTLDGRIELAPLGYCAETRIFTLENDLEYDDEMTLERACEIIRELLSEFPFHDDGRSLAVQVAAMMTVFAVGILPRTAARPGFIYTANDSDAGKTLAAKVAIIPVLGRVNTRAFPRKEETRKVLDQLAMDGAVTILFDNVKGVLGGEDIEAFMSAPRWSGRILGEKGGFDVENVTTCFFTGNESQPTRDMAQRCLFVELFLEHVDSSQRKIRRVLNDRVLSAPKLRGDVCSALWTLVKAWDAAGRPRPSSVMPKCPEWSETIGAIVEHAGFGDCCAKPEIASSGGDVLEVQRLVRELAPGETEQSENTFAEVMAKVKELGLFETRELKNRKGEVEEMYGEEGNLTPAARSHFGRLFKRFHERLFMGEEGERLRMLIQGPKDNRKFVVRRESQAVG